MVNHFRAQMPRPIVGIGHSMGGSNLVNLSLMHPRLLETLVLIDPVIARLPSVNGNWGPASASAFRRDRWPSRKVAETSFKRSKFYQTWDPRVLDRWIKYGLRELPTKIYPDPQPMPAATGSTVTPEPTVTPNVTANYEEKEVTLTTTKHQDSIDPRGISPSTISPLLGRACTMSLASTRPFPLPSSERRRWP